MNYYESFFEDGVLDSLEREIIKNKYAVVDYPNTLMEQVLNYEDSEIEAYKYKKENYPNAKVIKADIIMLCWEEARILYKFKPV